MGESPLSLKWSKTETTAVQKCLARPSILSEMLLSSLCPFVGTGSFFIVYFHCFIFSGSLFYFFLSYYDFFSQIVVGRGNRWKITLKEKCVGVGRDGKK